MSAEHRERPLQVVVFGAGIAGLTAAHELAERGFDVEVYEKAPPSPWERISTRQASCSVGGMARTQWTQTTRRFGPQRDGLQPTGTITVIDPVRIELSKPTTKLDAEGLRRELADPERHEKLRRKLKRVLKQLEKVEHAQIEVRGFCDAPILPKAWDYSLEQLDKRRAQPEHEEELLDKRPDLVFAAEVARILADLGFDPTRLHLRAMGLGRRDDWTRAFWDRNFVEFVVREDWLPGEHGFRFFPAFYRHVFDTMRRTPIAIEAPHARSGSVYQESDRTVLDNIVPTEMMGMRTANSPVPFGFRRSAVNSLEEIFDQGVGMLKAMGFPLADLDRFQAKLFKYMTSCPERREAEYENQTWWEYLDAEKFSPEFRHYLDSTAEALVAMNARKSDARTYGNVSVQMLQDQLSSGQHTDGTLNGPTSLAWFDHWRRYLEYQGVKFHQGELVGFEWHGGRPWPIVERAEKGKPKRRVLGRDYFVVALPVMEMSKLARQVVDDIEGRASDELPHRVPRDFRALCTLNWGDPTLADPGGSVDHMAGIQFFFDGDLKILHGHILYPDTAWRLSAVGQPQFWRAKRGWWSGYRGILSVDVSNWHNDGGRGGPGIAWDKTRQEIADQVWKQICDSGGPPTVDAAGRVKRTRAEDLPRPTLYHLDENIVFGADGRPARNLTPLLINLKSEFRQRPGIPDDYELNFGCLVLAGTYMQTYTRLTTMESANESGRHAVNAILRAERFKKEELCMVADPEDHELPDLRQLVELDRKLFADRLPHFVDILDMNDVPRELLRAAPDLSALGLGERMREVASGRASR